MKLATLLLEFIKLDTVCDSNLCIDVSETDHADERSKERKIPINYIMSIIKKAIPYLNTFINMASVRPEIISTRGKYFHIKYNNINIIGVFRFDVTSKKYLFHIVTAIKKNNFSTKSNTQSIEVK